MRSYRDELYHHGVTGQKWGVKHGPPYPLERNSSKKTGKTSDKQKETSAKKTGKSNVKKMESEELEQIVRRLELEKKYVTLTTQPSTTEKVLSWLGKTGSMTLQQAVKNVAAPKLTDYLNNLINARAH